MIKLDTMSYKFQFFFKKKINWLAYMIHFKKKKKKKKKKNLYIELENGVYILNKNI
jgi:hypothetical protein